MPQKAVQPKTTNRPSDSHVKTDKSRKNTETGDIPCLGTDKMTQTANQVGHTHQVKNACTTKGGKTAASHCRHGKSGLQEDVLCSTNLRMTKGKPKETNYPLGCSPRFLAHLARMRPSSGMRRPSTLENIFKHLLL